MHVQRRSIYPQDVYRRTVSCIRRLKPTGRDNLALDALSCLVMIVRLG